MTKFCLLVLLLGCSIQASYQQTLKSLSEQHQRYVGVALTPAQLSEQDFTAVLDREIDSLTPENEMKWGSVEQTRGQLNLAPGDKIVAHGQQHGMKVRGHTLVWHSQLPSWVEQGHFSATDLRTIMQQHIKSLVGHWKGKIYAWDVVNEIFNEDGTFRNSVFFSTLGKSFVADAFKAAHEADPAAKLYINDYNVESVNRKSTAMLELIKELKSQNVPVDGAGLQSHFTINQVPGDLHTNIARFAAAGVDVAITELDIAIPLPADQQKLAQQAKDYATVFGACVAVQRCVGVTFWGLTDRHSWIPDFSNHAKGAALPYDEHLKEKPAIVSIRTALSK